MFGVRDMLKEWCGNLEHRCLRNAIGKLSRHTMFCKFMQLFPNKSNSV